MASEPKCCLGLRGVGDSIASRSCILRSHKAWQNAFRAKIFMKSMQGIITGMGLGTVSAMAAGMEQGRALAELWYIDNWDLLG